MGGAGLHRIRSAGIRGAFRGVGDACRVGMQHRRGIDSQPRAGRGDALAVRESPSRKVEQVAAELEVDGRLFHVAQDGIDRPDEIIVRDRGLDGQGIGQLAAGKGI